MLATNRSNVTYPLGVLVEVVRSGTRATKVSETIFINPYCTILSRTPNSLRS